LSLHARVQGVGPTAWEDESLAQVWGPRLAVYVVPKSDLAVFTIGRLPRDEEKRQAIEKVADEAARVLGEGTMRIRSLFEALSTDTNGLRATGATGRLLLRWDTRDTMVSVAERPQVDLDEARVELARRFLHWFGPATADQFTRWAGVERRDGRATWALLERELIAVELEGRSGFVLASDESAFRRSRPIEGVRLLPFGDPYLYADDELLVPDAARGEGVWAPAAKVPRMPNGKPFMPGAILVDGEIVGIWGRQQGRIALKLWDALARHVEDEVRAEAESFAQALGLKVRAEWLRE
jgi:hypothetical protein